MATGRDYLQSIMASLARLQELSDNQLNSVSEGLQRVDDDLTEAVEYFEV